MPIRFRKTIRLLPFLRLNLSRAGASLTAHAGPFSVNSRTRRGTVDLPGPVSYQTPRARRGRRRR